MTKVYPSLSIVMTLLLALSPIHWAQANTIFEGYSKIIASGKHVGYVIQRYEYLPKKKQFISTSFLKTNASGGNISESLRAVSTKKLKPISYQYTSKVGKQTRTIDAKFAKNVMTATVNTSGKINQIQKKLPTGAFLSTFLLYLMLDGPQGLKPKTKYTYHAISEEDAQIHLNNVAYIDKEEKYQGRSAFKILNQFKQAKFVSYVSSQGEVLGTHSPIQRIKTELVASPSEATQNVAFPKKTISYLFGGIPAGKNSLTQQKSKTPSAPVKTGKKGP